MTSRQDNLTPPTTPAEALAIVRSRYAEPTLADGSPAPMQVEEFDIGYLVYAEYPDALDASDEPQPPRPAAQTSSWPRTPAKPSPCPTSPPRQPSPSIGSSASRPRSGRGPPARQTSGRTSQTADRRPQTADKGRHDGAERFAGVPERRTDDRRRSAGNGPRRLSAPLPRRRPRLRAGPGVRQRLSSTPRSRPPSLGASVEVTSSSPQLTARCLRPQLPPGYSDRTLPRAPPPHHLSSVSRPAFGGPSRLGKALGVHSGCVRRPVPLAQGLPVVPLMSIHPPAGPSASRPPNLPCGSRVRKRA